MVGIGLILGPIQFFGREVPDTINFGGKQMLAIHKSIGGSRVIDAMGPDPSVIQWSAMLLTHVSLGIYADERARLIDALRASGEQVMLTWPGFARDVVVASFEAKYKNEWEIYYTISCVCVVDAWEANSLAPTLGQAIGADIASLAAMVL